MSAQRLFFALWPDESSVEQLRRIEKRLEPDIHGRLLPPENLHITLSFLGSVDEGQVPEVESSMNAISVEPFTLVLDKMINRPRQQMIWLAASKLPEPLQTLVERIRAGMSSLGIEQETRPFLAHMTLARKVRRFPRERIEDFEPVQWLARSFVLVRSTTLPTGAQYAIVRQQNLGA